MLVTFKNISSVDFVEDIVEAGVVAIGEMALLCDLNLARSLMTVYPKKDSPSGLE